ncbi:MAG: acyl carrier protein [Candidatus Omnitrophica bacterium CG11_big_fil_rev_8_21_14_0_20_42_13]|uniref:Acyl carrier protein n=1 Tax=Candidatus Ghiorseimicrobium undicola TaxID=1974746 RepID=A0A2H0LWA7_9BACT|nr:MAG: acyl carrier protein [Candidatus Omnitrophica bacterium CG11_big_fil_rev_8_21_14_0_20_42_13]
MNKKNRTVVEGKISEIISERLDIKKEDIKPESKLREDLGIDSFGLVELSFEVKDKFGLELKDQDFKSITTVNDVVDYIFNNMKGD